MQKRYGAISLVVLVLCGAILVLFTDLEVSLVRWINCGPWSTQSEDRSDVCR